MLQPQEINLNPCKIEAGTQESAMITNYSANKENTPGPSCTSQTIRRRKHPPELIEAGETMKNALNTLNDVLREKRVNSFAQEDDCDLYGRMLAKKLRRFPENVRLNIMYE